MDYYLFFALIAYASGAYGLSFGVYKALQSHLKNITLHNFNKPVYEDVCKERVKRIDEKLDDIKNDLSEIKEKI